MKEKSKFLLKNIGVFTIGSFGSKILSFLLVPLYTAVLSTEEYGTVDLVTTTASLLMPILLLSIFDATLRFGMDENYQKVDVISTSINIAIKGSIILILGSIIIAFMDLNSVSNLYLLFLCIYFILGAINQILNLYLRAKNQASTIAISGILCTLVSCLSNIIFLLVLKFGIVGFMISNTFGILVQDLYQLFIGKVYKDIKFQNYNNISKPMIRYSAPLIANSLSWWINNASDRYILTFMKGVAENGIYSVSYKIPTLLTMFQQIFYNAWSISAIAEFDNNDKDGFIGNNYSMYTFISLFISSGLMIINIPLASFLYQGEYFIAWKAVPFLLMGTVFSGISQFEGSLFAATKNTKLVAKSTLIGAIANTVLNFILINYLGFIGASLATLLGYFITWALRTKYLMSFIHMKVNWKVHLFSLSLVFIQSILSTLGISWYLQVLVLIFLVLINYKYFNPILKLILRK